VKIYWFIPLVALLSGCGDNTADTQDQQTEVRSVKYTEITFEDYEQSRQFAGAVKSATTSPLSFKVNGTTANIAVKKGEVVTKGQLIAELEQEEFVIALQKAKASLGSAIAAKRQVEDQYQRAVKLQDKGFVSDSELLSIKADLDAKTQQTHVAQTDVNNAQLSLKRTKLYAPFAGQVSAVYLDEFTKINSGTTVVELISYNAYQVDFLVPESLIGEVNFGDKLNVTIPALHNLPFVGEVSEIGAVVEKGNAYSVTLIMTDAKLAENAKLLRNGMSANIDFRIGDKKQNVVRLPLEAFDLSAPDGKHTKTQAPIFVITPEMTLEKRYVDILRTVNTRVVVVNNLVEGEKVVVAGVPYLYEGQKVSLWKGI